MKKVVSNICILATFCWPLYVYKDNINAKSATITFNPEQIPSKKRQLLSQNK